VSVPPAESSAVIDRMAHTIGALHVDLAIAEVRLVAAEKALAERDAVIDRLTQSQSQSVPGDGTVTTPSA
jgi:hypothetical protein